ncbi:hypothetical protein DFH06DRAFT_297634 [Mycena polygramma]|nr:hypothetical protein DFH06DRAFT_297634 [Mycena polygramma]
MLSIIRRALAIVRRISATRDSRVPDAPTVAARTRIQRTRSRTASLKGDATCSRHSLHVTITSAPHAHDVLAAATGVRDATASPIFILKHTTTSTTAEEQDDEVASNTSERTTAQNIPLPHRTEPADAYEHAYDPADDTCGGCEAAAIEWRSDENDANAVEILQNCGHSKKCTALMDLETSYLLTALQQEPGTIIWEPELPGAPFIVLTPSDEDWDEFLDRCSNQPIAQHEPYLHVPLILSASSPYGPTEPAPDSWEVITVFSPSRFAASVCMTLEQAPYQALFTQRHTYKAVAYVAALSGESVRAYYDDPAVLQRLDRLAAYGWTDPAAPLLKMWRGCFMVMILESEHPFAGVPHIVVNGTLSNAPWDVEPAVLPEQDDALLSVPAWSYMQFFEEQQEEEVCGEDAWYKEEEEASVQYCPVPLSESEDESDEARTPSPPSWPLTFPSSTVRNSTLLADVFEEEEDRTWVPSVTEALVRKPWLQEDDEEASSRATTPTQTSLTPPGTLSSRFNFNTTLPAIDEAVPEAAYRPTAAGYRPLWTSDALEAVDASGDNQSVYTDALGDDQSIYTDALEEQPSETDADQSESEDRGEARRYRRANALLRPSCNIFSNADDDASVKSPTPAASLALPASGSGPVPKGKANIPAGKIDWFDLPEDDLGELDWAT